MSDHIRDLLICMASHMAYMQGQLEAHHQFDELEDYYWYRESVALREKVTDALLDTPTAPWSWDDSESWDDSSLTAAERNPGLR